MSSVKVVEVNSAAVVVIGEPFEGAPPIPNSSPISYGDAPVPDWVQSGAAGLERGLQSASKASHDFAMGAQFVKHYGGAFDLVNITYQFANQSFAAGVVETGGAIGGAVGGLAGARIFEIVASMGFKNPAARMTAEILGAAFGNWAGNDVTKWLFANYIDTPPPLPNDTVVDKPTIVTAEGYKYVLGVVDGKANWYSMIDNQEIPNRYSAVIREDILLDLNNAFLGDILAPESNVEYRSKRNEFNTLGDLAKNVYSPIVPPSKEVLDSYTGDNIPPANGETARTDGWRSSQTPVNYESEWSVVIQQGDTLWKIANDQQNNHENPIDDKDIAKINGLSSSDVLNLQIGQKIWVPKRSGDNLVVDTGDMQFTMNAKNGTFDLYKNDTELGVTIRVTRSLEAGQYVDRYVETDNQTSEVIVQSSRTTVNQGYRELFGGVGSAYEAPQGLLSTPDKGAVHVIGSDAYGNTLIAQETGTIGSDDWSRIVATVDKVTGVQSPFFQSRSEEIKDGEGSVIGYKVIDQGADSNPMVISTLGPDFNTVKTETINLDGNPVSYTQAGIRIEIGTGTLGDRP